MTTEAITMHGRPEVINSDEGSSFISEEYTALFLKGDVAEGAKISLDGKGRAIDNVFIERFWRTLKHDKLYLAPPTDWLALYQGCGRFVDRCNHRRLHSSLNYRTPAACYHMAA